MPYKKQPQYECARCVFCSDDRTNMRRHLYKKKLCPATRNDIDLTEEIKQYILTNRIYRSVKTKPLKEKNVINQYINNYNVLNNFVGGMDTLEKLMGYVQHKNLTIKPLDYQVELKFAKEKEQLSKGIGHYNFTQKDMFDMIDDLTTIDENCVEDYNVHLDQSKLVVYEGGDWKEMYKTHGLQYFIRIIKENYWDTYEVYLIRKIRDMDLNFSERIRFKYYLQEYYTFLACTDNDPYVKDRPDNQVIYNADDDRYWDEPSYVDIDSHKIADEYMRLYTQWKTELRDKDRDKLQRELSDLLRNNSKKNIQDLNKLVMSLINVDATYKEKLMTAGRFATTEP
jgi:hypothetical protein